MCGVLLTVLLFNLFDSCEDFVEIDRQNYGFKIMCNNTLDDSWGDQEIAIGSYKLIFRTNMNNKKWVKRKGFQIYSLCFETKCKSDCLSHFIVSIGWLYV